MVEIDCPSTCGYLAAAAVHPPVAVRRQQERDLGLLMPAIDGLTDSQGQLLSLVFSVASRHGSGGLGSAADSDVVDGVSALLATFETAGRGVIYEHRPSTLAGQRIATDLGAVFADVAGKAGRSVDADATIVLARVKRLAEAVLKVSPGNGRAFLDFVKRVAKSTEQGADREQTTDRPAIIMP